MTLLICFPKTISILIFGKTYSVIFENKKLIAIGTISYELYLVHDFCGTLVNKDYIHLLMFVMITLVGLTFLYFLLALVRG